MTDAREQITDKKNTKSFCFLISVFCLLFSVFCIELRAEEVATQIIDALQNPTGELQETSKPIFDPDFIDAQSNLVSSDKALAKIQEQTRKFNQEQKAKRREFFQEIREKNLPIEKSQEKLREFRKKETEDQKEFFEKQQKKMQKYREDQEDQRIEDSGHDNFIVRQTRERNKFLQEQSERRNKFLKEFNESRQEGKDSPEELQEKFRKFSEEQLGRQQEFNKKQREQVEKKAAEG